MDCIPPVVLAAPESEVKKHPDYHAAKGGDADAAFRLIRDLLTERAVTELADLAGNDRPMLVAVHAEEEFGKNAIPEALADVLGVRLGLDVEETIVQANVVNHTGADGFSRLARQAVFAGDVKRHQLFVMVDDFVGQGGTLANLKGHIETRGSRVLGALALTGKPHSAKLALTPERLATLREKHGALEHWWQEEFGFGFDRLTESEARYLEITADADTIRNRIAAARQAAGAGAG